MCAFGYGRYQNTHIVNGRIGRLSIYIDHNSAPLKKRRLFFRLHRTADFFVGGLLFRVNGIAFYANFRLFMQNKR